MNTSMEPHGSAHGHAHGNLHEHAHGTVHGNFHGNVRGTHQRRLNCNECIGQRRYHFSLWHWQCFAAVQNPSAALRIIPIMSAQPVGCVHTTLDNGGPLNKLESHRLK